jgi:hypothetical protein
MIEFCLLWLNVLADLLRVVVLGLRSNSSLAAENLFLRKQLAFYEERKVKPRRADNPARLSLVLLSRWFNWRSALTVVTPRTFIGWQRKRSQLFWRRECQAGRPQIPPELQRLIRTMARENPSWGPGANCQRVAGGTRPARVAAHRPQISAKIPDRTGRQPSPRSALVDLSQEPRGGHHRLRLLRRRECHLSNPLRAGGHGTCFPPNHSPQPHCPSDCGLDPPTAA